MIQISDPINKTAVLYFSLSPSVEVRNKILRSSRGQNKDILESKSTISDLEVELDKLLVIGDKISNQYLNIDSVINIYRFELNPLFNAFNNFNRNTFDGLLATGNINLIEKDLNYSLMTLFDLQEKTIQTINVNLEFYKNYTTRANLPFNDKLNAIGGEPLEEVWRDPDKVEFIRNLSAMLSSKTLAYRTIIKSRKELLSETETVLRKLDK